MGESVESGDRVRLVNVGGDPTKALTGRGGHQIAVGTEGVVTDVVPELVWPVLVAWDGYDVPDFPMAFTEVEQVLTQDRPLP